MTDIERRVDNLASEAVSYGFIVINHTEKYSDLTPVYDTEGYIYLEKGNLVMTLSKEYGSVLLENRNGGLQLSSTINEFYFYEVYGNTVTVGIGNYTQITLEA